VLDDGEVWRVGGGGDDAWLLGEWLERACRSSCGWYRLEVLLSLIKVSRRGGAGPWVCDGCKRKGSQSIDAVVLLLVDGRRLESIEGRASELLLASLGARLGWYCIISAWLLTELVFLLCSRFL
jgi:hypothetical protein